MHEDVAKTSGPFADNTVVVDGGDDIEIEIVFTFDERGRLDVEEFPPSSERSVVDALGLLSP